ncbi:MAG: choice-of-anchor D domain-containing protein [Xanthomonadales bacterium]|nr:choice-of-anchor D domain-containing protein [Xanthomonadales bacterium]
MKTTNSLTKNTKTLPYAIVLALTTPLTQAATFNVTEPLDDGTGLVANTLSWAILQANTTAGADTIELNTDVTITGVMKRLIDSDTILQSDATRRTIDGNNQFRPLFIKSGQVTIQNLDIENGLAQGGGSFNGGRGAGMGGALFVYDGNVIINQTNFLGSNAIGGDGFWDGGGGMFGSSSSSGGAGGLFADGVSTSGGYGGYGNYQNQDASFGRGGNSGYSAPGQNGGFGGGGGQGYNDNGGDGGFGGGGGYNYLGGGRSGDGGFGAGGGLGSLSGFGGYKVLAAGMGGGIFIRSGYLTISDVVIENNNASKTVNFGYESEGWGGALFVLHTTQNSNGNNQGMPNSLPTVTGCGVIFINNTADTDPNQPNNNDDIFDLGNRIQPDDGISLTTPCGPPDQEIQITGNGIEIVDGDITPDLSDGTDMGEEVAGFNQAIQTFTIENLGNHAIQLTGNPLVSLTNNNNLQFEVIQQPASSVVLGGQSVDFQVAFSPQQIGLDTATLVIESNDADENPYDFVIQGVGLDAIADINVTGNGVDIVDGDVTPDVADDTDFGASMIGLETVTKTFTIDNINGYAGLSLTGNPVVELINNSSQFAVTTQPASNSLEPGQSVTFDVTFAPASVGTDTVTVSIASNDADENPYDFVIQAEAIVPSPEIDLYGDTFNPIADGDITPSPDEGTYLGEAQENGQTITRTFYIDNFNGLGDLILSGNPVIELQNNAGQFTVTSQPNETVISPGNFTTFEITFTPTSIGTDTATVVIQNNDPDEAPYDFLIEAEGNPQAPVLQVLGNDFIIDNGDDTPANHDNTWFGYTPVNGGQVDHTFELKNIGLADLNLSGVVLDQVGAHFSIIQNINDQTLSPNESTTVEVRFDPFYPSYNFYTTFDVYDDNNQRLHYHFIEGFGQSTITINAQNNYLQEGDVAQFVVERDVATPYDTTVNWAVSGQVDAADFGGSLPSGSATLPANINQVQIEFSTVRDGVYEGPEIFNIQLSNSDDRINLGFPSVSGGVIDDDWIFDDGFEVPALNQIIAAIAKYAFDLNEVPVCNELACNFLQRSLTIDSEQVEIISTVAWFEETLVLKQPNGDWDGDGLSNHHDLNPFGLSHALLSQIKY